MPSCSVLENVLYILIFFSFNQCLFLYKQGKPTEHSTDIKAKEYGESVAQGFIPGAEVLSEQIQEGGWYNLLAIFTLNPACWLIMWYVHNPSRSTSQSKLSSGYFAEIRALTMHWVLTSHGVSWPSGLAYRTQVLVLAAECGFRIPAMTLVSLSKTLNHNCFSPPRGQMGTCESRVGWLAPALYAL